MAYASKQDIQRERRAQIPGSGEVMEGSQRQRPTSGKPEQERVQQKPGGPDTPETYAPRPDEPFVSKGVAPNLFKEARDAYEGVDYGYDPYMQDQGGFFQEQDFNPYREGVTAQADKGRAQQQQGAYNALLQEGPVSASDRMQLASNFNQQKITGALGAGFDANQRQNQNEMRTGQQNISRGMDVNMANAGAQNQMARFKASAEDSRRYNLYRGDLEEKMLQRKLAAARDIAKAGGGHVDNSIFGAIGSILGGLKGSAAW